LSGSIGCGALGVSGQGGDSVIRLSENLQEGVTFPEAQGITQSINESVSVSVT